MVFTYIDMSRLFRDTKKLQKAIGGLYQGPYLDAPEDVRCLWWMLVTMLYKKMNQTFKHAMESKHQRCTKKIFHATLDQADEAMVLTILQVKIAEMVKEANQPRLVSYSTVTKENDTTRTAAQQETDDEEQEDEESDTSGGEKDHDDEEDEEGSAGAAGASSDPEYQDIMNQKKKRGRKPKDQANKDW